MRNAFLKKCVLRSTGYFLVFFVGWISMAADNTLVASEPNSDFNYAYAEARRLLGEEPMGLLAEVSVGYAQETKGSVTLKWAIGESKLTLSKSIGSDTKQRLFYLDPTQKRTINERLREPRVLKQIQNLPSRTTIPPDSDYRILFVQIANEKVILRSWHPDAIISIRDHLHISERQAIANLGADYLPMISCWSSIEQVFEPVTMQP